MASGLDQANRPGTFVGDFSTYHRRALASFKGIGPSRRPALRGLDLPGGVKFKRRVWLDAIVPGAWCPDGGGQRPNEKGTVGEGRGWPCEGVASDGRECCTGRRCEHRRRRGCRGV